MTPYARRRVRAGRGALPRPRPRRAGIGIGGGGCAGFGASVQYTPVHQQVQQFGEEERVAVDPREQGVAGGLVQFGTAQIVA